MHGTLSSDMLRAIREAPLLSPSASRLLQVSTRSDYDLQEVVRIVKNDSVLTARLLRVVNSPFYGLRAQVTTVDRAIMLLGTSMVVGVALSDSVQGLLGKPLDGYGGERGMLMRHELFCALCSKFLAKAGGGRVDPELAFTGGLLHDIGKAILSDFMKGRVQEAVAEVDRQEGGDYLAAERRLVGADHTEIGLELAKNWELPDVLQAVIRHHHEPEQAEEEHRAMVYAVHLGDILAMMEGHGTGSDAMQYQLRPGYTAYLDLSQEKIAEIVLTAHEEFQKASDSFENK